MMLRHYCNPFRHQFYSSGKSKGLEATQSLHVMLRRISDIFRKHMASLCTCWLQSRRIALTLKACPNCKRVRRWKRDNKEVRKFIVFKRRLNFSVTLFWRKFYSDGEKGRTLDAVSLRFSGAASLLNHVCLTLLKFDKTLSCLG